LKICQRAVALFHRTEWVGTFVAVVRAGSSPTARSAVRATCWAV
jgi:hypothetical protein